jgi:hypothetical protein
MKVEIEVDAATVRDLRSALSYAKEWVRENDWEYQIEGEQVANAGSVLAQLRNAVKNG